MQETANKQKRIADEMDINLEVFNLEVFNLETDFFGDLHCSSRFTDMLCDAQAQYGDYSELDMCPMWGMWQKLMKMVEGEMAAMVSQHTKQ